MQTPKFRVEFLEEAADFLDSLNERVRDKIIYNITKARFSSVKDLFKKLNNEIWEFRALINKTHYRLFAFWDKSERGETLVITTHGLIKKTDKIPKGDLEKAERLRKKYLHHKDNDR